MQFIQVNSPEEGYQIDSDEMAVSANKEPTKRAPANHSAASKYHFETPPESLHLSGTLPKFQYYPIFSYGNNPSPSEIRLAMAGYSFQNDTRRTAV